MKRQHNIYLAFIIAFLASHTLSSQQVAYTSLFDGTKSYWNPAAAGTTPHMKTDVWFRHQWIGFGSSAPRTGFVGFDMPFIDMNMAAGGMVTFDQTGPVSKTGLQLNYNYKLQSILTEDGQLSLGVSGGFHQYSFSADDVLFYDVNDVLLQGNSTSTIYPTVGAGLYFISTDEEYYGNQFYFGLGYNQVYTTNVLINEFNQERQSHVVFNIGTKLYGDESYLEPSLTVNYTNPELIDFILGAKYELQNSFWAGLGYSSVNDIAIQGGYTIDRFGGRGSQLKIGVLGNIGISESANQFGPGAELYIAYLFELGRSRWR